MVEWIEARECVKGDIQNPILIQTSRISSVSRLGNIGRCMVMLDGRPVTLDASYDVVKQALVHSIETHIVTVGPDGVRNG